jgi:hypothetical protein
LAGYFSAETHQLVSAPIGCDTCYTLSFDTDTTATGLALVDSVRINTLPVPFRIVATQNGTDSEERLYIETLQSVIAYSVDSSGLKLLYKTTNSDQLYYMWYTHHLNEFDKMAATINNYLSKQNRKLNDSLKLEALRDWLKSNDYISDAEILCNSCVKTQPAQSEVFVAYAENRQIKYMIFDIAMSNPLRCVGHHIEDITYEPYIPMISTENQWNELSVNYLLPPFYERTHVTKLGNDTVVNGLPYYKLLTARDSLSAEWEANGFIWVDTVLQRVYYKPIGKPDVLLYAFRAKVGDVLISYDVSYQTKIIMIVEDITSMLIGGVEHKAITVHTTYSDYNSNTYHTWIEGVGDDAGLLRSNIVMSASGDENLFLRCFFKNGALVYQSEAMAEEDCFIWEYVDFRE